MRDLNKSISIFWGYSLLFDLAPRAAEGSAARFCNSVSQHLHSGCTEAEQKSRTDDGAFEAKHGENLKMKPACKGLNWYFGVFDCER